MWATNYSVWQLWLVVECERWTIVYRHSDSGWVWGKNYNVLVLLTSFFNVKLKLASGWLWGWYKLGTFYFQLREDTKLWTYLWFEIKESVKLGVHFSLTSGSWEDTNSCCSLTSDFRMMRKENMKRMTFIFDSQWADANRGCTLTSDFRLTRKQINDNLSLTPCQWADTNCGRTLTPTSGSI